MPYKNRKFTCTGCGKTFWRNKSRNWVPKCFECALEAMIANTNDMMHKRGPGYVRWLQGMKRAIERESRYYENRIPERQNSTSKGAS